MIDIKSILCPVDLSDFSKRALEHAMAIAQRYEATVTVLYVCPGLPPLAYADGIPPVRATVLTSSDRERLLSELRSFAACDAASSVQLRPAVREGDVVAECLSEAASIKADLLTLGTHGRSGFERVVLGSVAEKLLRKAPCPVLTVPRPQPDAAASRPGVFARILCPIDFSPCSMAALRYATSMAQENDAELTVLYVVPNDFLPLPGQPAEEALDKTISVAEFFIKREAHVRALLGDAVPDSARTYCTVQTVMKHGKPSTEILALAREHSSDLIVIGVRGRGAADLAIFGSTTQHVVRQAACPVLTVREE